MPLRLACIAALVVGCTSSDVDSSDYGLDTDTTTTDSSTADTTVKPVDPLAGIGTVVPVAEGFAFTEGPTWRAADGVLLFTDIPNARIHRLAPPDTVDVFDPASGGANGLDTDVDGSLLTAEHETRRVTRRDAAGKVVTTIDSYKGSAFNSPNDLAVRSDGSIYFTDPPYGLAGRTREITFNGLYRVSPGTTVAIAEWEGDANATRPNGLVLSPDESLLYLADTLGGVTVFDVATNGALSNPRTFTDDVQNADGMAMDEAGNLYVTAQDGVRVFAPDGTHWGTISVPEQPANCAFGGADRRTLYMTSRSRVYAVDLANPGRY